MTHAVDCQNHEIAKTLLEFAAKNSLLRDKSIPIKDKRTRIAKEQCGSGCDSVKESNTSSDSDDVSLFDCTVNQIHPCGQRCHVQAQDSNYHSQFLESKTLEEPSEVWREKPFYHFHVLEEDVENPFESAFYTREEVANPLLRACLNDDYEMIVLFLEYGFVIWDPERVNDETSYSSEFLSRPKSSEEECFYPYHPNNHKEWFLSFACQRALCSPSYINLTESQTVMRCLQLASRFKLRAQHEIDYREVFESLMDKCISYATELLNVCRDDGVYDGDGDDPLYAAQEMEVLLGICYGARKDKLSPLINTAMNKDIVDFYTHDKCYKFIEKMWNPAESVEMSNTTINNNRFAAILCMFMSVIQMVALTLVTSLISPLLYFFHSPYSEKRAVSEQQSFKHWKEKCGQLLSKMATPRNSYASHIHFYFMFCILLMVEVMAFTENTLFCLSQLRTNSWLILVCITTMFFHLIEMITIEKSAFWREFWNIYSALNVVLFVAAYVIWFYAIHSLSEMINDPISPMTKMLHGSNWNMDLFSMDSEDQLWPSTKYLKNEECFIEIPNSTYKVNVCRPFHRVYWNQRPKFHGKEEDFVMNASRSMNFDDWATAALNYWTLPYLKLISLEETIFKVAVLMHIGRFAHIFQFHKALAIMNLMMVKTVKLISCFAIILFMYAFCFAICIKMTYVNYQGMWQITLDPLTNLPVCQQMASKYASLTETLLTLFWNLFGKGETDDLQIFLPNLRKAKKQSSDPDEFLDPENMLRFREMLCKADLDKADFLKIMAMDPLNYEPKDVENDFNFAPNTPLTPWMGELFLGLFNVFAVIVMLNLLIALMSNGFEKGKRFITKVLPCLVFVQ